LSAASVVNSEELSDRSLAVPGARKNGHGEVLAPIQPLASVAPRSIARNPMDRTITGLACKCLFARTPRDRPQSRDAAARLAEHAGSGSASFAPRDAFVCKPHGGALPVRIYVDATGGGLIDIRLPGGLMDQCRRLGLLRFGITWCCQWINIENSIKIN
jgi:hypothetical protein